MKTSRGSLTMSVSPPEAIPAASAPQRIERPWRELGSAIVAVRPAAPTLVVPAAFLVVLGALWWPFATSTGMAWDTTLVYTSETSSFWEGFLYRYDPLRIYTGFFYQAGYQFSNLVGIDGDYLGYYVVYGFLWLGRGVLTYLILRRLFPQYDLFPFLVAILVLVHASDHALKMIGQTNQFGMLFWMFLALYLLVLAMTTTRMVLWIIFMLGSLLTAHMCLWSYESPVFLLLVVPVLFMLALPDRRRALVEIAVFYVVPAWYIYRHVERYLDRFDTTYQSAVAREDWNPSGVIADFVFNVRASLEFWNWGEWAAAPRAATTAFVLAAVASAAVLLAGLALIRYARARDRPLLPSGRPAVVLLAAGVIVLSASFPAYLASIYARDLWRTQFLSGVGAALVIATVLAIGASLMRRATVGAVLATLIVASVTFVGTMAAYRAGQNQYDTWERQRRVMEGILEAAPRVDANTVVVLTGVPKTADPFGHNMWFDFAVRLAYPHVPVAGIFFYDNGEPSVGSNMTIVNGRWSQVPTVSISLVQDAPLANTVVVRVDPNGHGHLVSRLPPALPGAPRDQFEPRVAIAGPEPSPVARRRYELGG
jgi:hypothetical protein